MAIRELWCITAIAIRQESTLEQIERVEEERSVRGHIVFTVVLLAAIVLAYVLRHVLIILYVSALFAVILSPVIARFETLRFRGKHISKAVAVLLLFAALAIAGGLFFWIGLPPVLSDLSSFIAESPRRIPQILSRLEGLPFGQKLDLSKIAAEAQNKVGAVAAYIFTALPDWAAHVLDLVTAVILCVYFILEGGEVYKFFVSVIPVDKRTRLENTAHRAEERVSKWLIGQLALMGLVALYCLALFGFLHVRYFVLLAILMGITNIIPVAGNLITITLAILAAASDSWTKAVAVLVGYLIYTQIENALLTPRIMKSSVDLMGVTVLIALLIGTALAGIVGALVAVPTAAIVVVFADEYLVQREPAV